MYQDIVYVGAHYQDIVYVGAHYQDIIHIGAYYQDIVYVGAGHQEMLPKLIVSGKYLEAPCRNFSDVPTRMEKFFSYIIISSVLLIQSRPKYKHV